MEKGIIKMGEHTKKLFEDFILHQAVPEEIIQKYKDILPEELIEIWKEYGFGMTADGYLKVINPDEYYDELNKVYSIYDKNTMPVFITGMADIIAINDNKYFLCVNVRHQVCEIVGKKFELTMKRMKTEDFREVVLSWNPYKEAVEKYGNLNYEECFGYEPLLSLGGNESVENMKKLNFRIHLDIISQFQDVISF